MSSLTPPPPLDPGTDALFLDFDGTLVELAQTPDLIRVSPGLGAMLEHLRGRLNGRLAIVSGRSLDDLARHLPAAGIACSGSHGLELRRADGSALPIAVPSGLDRARDRIARFAAADDALLVETKPAGIALHYRQAPEAAARVDAFMAGLARETGLELQRGAMVAELRAAGATKGDALRALMKEPEFAGARPWFVGDDLTDEHAFEAAADLGGAGVLVGPARPTAARHRLGSVAAVAAWLGAAA